MTANLEFRATDRRHVEVFRDGARLGNIIATKATEARDRLDPLSKALASSVVWIIALNDGWTMSTHSLSAAKLEVKAHVNGTPRPWPFDRPIEQFVNEAQTALKR